MGLHDQVSRIGAMAGLDRVATPAAGIAKRIFGPGWRKDVLSGTWLGHPVHPLLTDIPIGAFASVTLLDLLAGPRGQDAADLLVAFGLVSALPTVGAGVADWSDTYGGEQRVGLVHACSNLVGLSLYAASLLARRRGNRGTGTFLGLAGMASMTVGGYLGGYLSYSRGVGVNHAFYQEGPDDWTAVIDDDALADATATKVAVGSTTVLLYRETTGSSPSAAAAATPEARSRTARSTRTRAPLPAHGIKASSAWATAASSTARPACPNLPTTPEPATGRSRFATGRPEHRPGPASPES